MEKEDTGNSVGVREYVNYWTNEHSLMNDPPVDPAIKSVECITVNRKISPSNLSFR